jgi:hypothetical protein
MADYYKFECDFYYLNYNIEDGLYGTIYRHYYYNNYIEYIHGCNELTTIELLNENKYIIINELKKLKKTLNCTDIIKKDDENSYLNMYDLNNASYENYKKISLCHLSNDYNIGNLIDIDIANINNMGIIFTFVKTDLFDFTNIQIKHKKEDDGQIKSFNNYFREYKYKQPLYDSKYIGIDKIITEQKYIYYETINYYLQNYPKNLTPVIIEYDYSKKQFYLVDGNNRVAYHIIKKHEFIPVFIIFQNLYIDIK